MRESEAPFFSFLSLFSFSSQGKRKSSIMVASWAGDAVAPFFGFIGAASALVFSCACFSSLLLLLSPFFHSLMMGV